MSDITEVLAKFSKDNLGKLHKDLISMVVDAFPSLQNRKPFKRQAVNTFIEDIVVLGCSIVNKSMHRDIERVFHPPSVTEDASNQSHVEEFADLLKVVADLSKRVSYLEKELAELRGSSHQNHPDDDSESNTDEAGSNEWQTGGNSRAQRRRERRNRQRNRTTIPPPPPPPPSSASTAGASSTSVSNSNPQPPAHNPTSPHGAQSSQAAGPLLSAPSVSQSQAQPLSAADSTVRSADAAKVSVYVGNIHPNNSQKDIEQHLRHLGVTQVLHIKTLSSHGAEKKSFCVQIPPQFKEAVLCQDKWPSNIRVRLFTPRSNRRPPPAVSRVRSREPDGRHRTPSDRYYSPYTHDYGRSTRQDDWDDRYYAWIRKQQRWRDY